MKLPVEYNGAHRTAPNRTDAVSEADSSPLLAVARTVALVGNGPVHAAAAGQIDAADVVIRMNRAQLCGVAGKRTDALALNASLERKFGATGRPIAGSALADAREFWVRGRKAGDLIHEERPVVAFGRDVMARARQALIAHGADPAKATPSLGASTLQYLLDQSDAEIVLYGFSHKGNDVHPWDAERRWVDTLVAQGKVRRAGTQGRRVRQPLRRVARSQFTRFINHIKGLRF